MKILYDETGSSLLKGALYAELTDCELEHKEKYEPSLFSGPVIEANDLDFEELLAKAREIRKKPFLFSKPGDLKALLELINWALRHSYTGKLPLILKALKQAIHSDIPQVFSGGTKVSRRLLALAEEVQNEVKLSGYQMKFHVLPDTQNIIYTRYNLKHKTFDLVLKKWTHVYPEYTFLLLLPEKSILGNRYGYKELKRLSGSPERLSRSIRAYFITTYPHRSSLISHHSQFVSQQTQRAGLQPAANKHVNYIDFYNKIKRGELFL